MRCNSESIRIRGEITSLRHLPQLARRFALPILIVFLIDGCGVDRASGLYREGSFTAASDSAQALLNQEEDGVLRSPEFIRRWASRDALAVLGWSQFMLGKLPAAERTFYDLGRQNRNSFDASLGLAWVQIKRGAHGRAKAYLDAAELMADQYQKFLVVDARGWNALGMGNLNKAEELFNGEDESYGEFQQPADEAQVGRGWVALARGRLGEAASAFREGNTRADEVNEGRCYLCYDGLAEVALARSDTTNALAAIQAGLAISNDHPKLIATLERILQRIKDPVRRKRILAGLEEANPGSAVYLAKLGWVQIETGEIAAARKGFDQALAIHANSSLARSGLEYLDNAAAAAGWTPYFSGDYRRALQICDSLTQRLKRVRSPAAQDCRGWSLYRLGRLDLARQAFMEALLIRPGFGSSARGLNAAEAVLLRDYRAVWRMILSHRITDARRALERARRTIPTDLTWRIREAEGWIAYFSGRKDVAEAAFRAVLAQHPHAALAEVGRGYLAADRGDPNAAEKTFREIAGRGQAAAAAAYVLAGERLMTGGRAVAAQAVLAAGSLEYPRSAEIAWTSAKFYKSLGDLDKAADKAVYAAQLAPDFVARLLDGAGFDPAAIHDANFAIAWAAYFGGRNREAVRRFNQYLAAGGAQPNARRGRGFATFRLNQTDKALADLQFAVSFEDAGLKPIVERVTIPRTGKKWQIAYNARSTLGWAYYRLRRYADAGRAFRAVLDNHPDWIDAYSGLGYTLLAQNKIGLARAAFRNALKQDPAYPDALRGIRLAGG